MISDLTMFPRSLTNNFLRSLTSVTALNLYENNHVTDLGIAHLTGIVDLNLWGNSKITCNAFRNLTNMTRLNLSFNDITINYNLCNLDNLKHLELSEFYGEIKIGGLTNLRTLGLYATDSIESNDLSLLTKLVSLDLGYADHIELENLKVLRNLTELDLMHNDGSADDTALGAFSNLTKLYLEGNRSITIAGLKSLPKLRELCLSDTKNIKTDELNRTLCISTPIPSKI